MRALPVLCLLASTPALADDAKFATVATVDAGTGDLAVHVIKPTKIDKVYSEKGGKFTELGWSDASTLWLLAVHESPVLVGKLVDGKLVEKIKVAPETFKLPKGVELEPRLVITTKGEVWLQHCLKAKGDTGDAAWTCVKGSWVRVDGKTQTQSAKAPAGIDQWRTTGTNLGEAPPFPTKVKAPKGYEVKLQQVTVDGLGDDQKKVKTKGAVCRGPSSSKTWPDDNVDIPFAMKPSRVTWLRAQPPVAMIDGKATNPIGDIEHHRAVFFDCKTIYADAMYFGAGAWGLQDNNQWTVYVEDKQVGTITAGAMRAAPMK